MLHVSWRTLEKTDDMRVALERMQRRSLGNLGLKSCQPLPLEGAFKNRLHTVRRGWLQSERKQGLAGQRHIPGIQPSSMGNVNTAPIVQPVNAPDQRDTDELGKIIQGKSGPKDSAVREALHQMYPHGLEGDIHI